MCQPDNDKDDVAFVMLVDSELGHCHFFQYAAKDFVAASDRFEVRVGRNVFTETSLHLDLQHDADVPGHGMVHVRIHADITLNQNAPWPVTLLLPGVMGWFAYLPLMECYHSVLSMHSHLEGSLTRTINKRTAHYDLQHGVGYVEKDWGITFPNPYVWLACNHFNQPGVDTYGPAATSLFLSVARVPAPLQLPFTFTGFIAGLRHQGRLFVFATYTGAWIVETRLNKTALTVVLRDIIHTLTVVAERQDTVLLYGPRNGSMVPVIPEGLGKGHVDCHLTRTWTGKTIFQGRGRNVGIEIVGDISTNRAQ